MTGRPSGGLNRSRSENNLKQMATKALSRLG